MTAPLGSLKRTGSRENHTFSRTQASACGRWYLSLNSSGSAAALCGRARPFRDAASLGLRGYVLLKQDIASQESGSSPSERQSLSVQSSGEAAGNSNCDTTVWENS